MLSESRNFGEYEIIRRLGTGGMAETFEARRKIGGTEQRVCLKRVLPAFSEDPKFNQQFLAEARLAASLRHSNIVSVLDFGAVDGAEFMVLELVDGLDLRALLASMDTQRLDAELVALIALDLAYALSYAHNTREAGLEGVVHRDISPANVLISVRGEVKLADFGIAKAMTNAQATASGLMKGKIPYMSPEQMRAEEVDGRADLFSLGVSLYEALAGERPFQGAHDVQVMTRLLAGERRPLRELAAEAPEDLVDAVESLLDIRVEQRTATAEQFIDELANCAPRPVARRRLAELVQQRGGSSAPRPGRDRASTGPLDTELASEPIPLGTKAASPAPRVPKAVFKATLPATPGVVQAAQIARAAAAAMGAGSVPGAGLSKSTIPSSPQ
ncbi:MAG: serine/threonine protein kinase, partial [Deltaproteobacteria bacterium]|nr:serine/threonine protein kinase [Deltaproteobacteria bacterium]